MSSTKVLVLSLAGLFNGRLADYVSPSARDRATIALVAEEATRILAQRYFSLKITIKTEAECAFQVSSHTFEK